LSLGLAHWCQELEYYDTHNAQIHNIKF
jgi:hypothetical protein